MERESFEDPETATLMNEHFVSVKVDREERPDVEPRTARHDGKVPPRLDLEHRGACLLAIAARAVAMRGLEEGDEVMGNACAILNRRGFGPDLEPAVDLARVGADDLPAETFREIERDEALP